MAHHGSYIVAFVDLLKNGHHDKAMSQSVDAKKELAFLKDRMNVMDKKKIDYLDRFIDGIRKGKTFTVTADLILAKTAVEQYYQKENRKTQADQTKQPILNKKQETQGRKLDSGNIGSTLVQNTTSVQNDSRTNFTSMVQNENLKSLSQSSGNTRKEQEEIKVDKNEKQERKQDLTKMAGQAMKYNNLNIADLSDENRPTKVAERYSELYDNEWAEAYEALSNKNRGEKEVIEILLCIIEEAYKYCKAVAEKQMKEMEQFIMELVSGDKSTRPVPKSEGLLLQYRKSVAAYTLGSLYEDFEKMNLQRIFQIRKMNPPSKGGRIEQYAKKAIELTWWMCVQDPPIHMCLHDEIQPSDYSSMFKAYTRSGKDLDFYVWPPIRLYKEGGLLTKGVMQFK